jgi:hypothetical protein
MCTMAAIRRGSFTILLKNLDLRKPVPTGWAAFEPFDGDHHHFAVINHGQLGVNSGLNERGLALQISQSEKPAPTPEREELRTVLNAEVLARSTTVEEGVEMLETYAHEHPAMLGGNVMLADSQKISVTEYFGGEAQSEILEGGVLVRANHSVFGLVDNKSEDSEKRYGEMVEFAKALYERLGDLAPEGAINKCKVRLRTAPVLQETTRSSFVITTADRRVDHMVGEKPWEIFSFPEAVETTQYS